MKRLLSLLFICLYAFAARAQNDTSYLQKFRENQAYLKKLQSNSWSALRKDTTQPNRLFSLFNPKPGVYRLRQDNMPCIVPDTKDLAIIPNAWKGPVKVPFRGNSPRIPNPALPVIIQPKGKP